AFQLHKLVGHVIAILTPVAVVAALYATANPIAEGESEGAADGRRKRLFTASFTLAPLSGFVIYSCRHEVKVHWTGPIWLATRRAMGVWLTAPAASFKSAVMSWVPAGLRFTVVVLAAAYAIGLYCLTAGMSQSSMLRKVGLPLAWREMARSVELL